MAGDSDWCVDAGDHVVGMGGAGVGVASCAGCDGTKPSMAVVRPEAGISTAAATGPERRYPTPNRLRHGRMEQTERWKRSTTSRECVSRSAQARIGGRRILRDASLRDALRMTAEGSPAARRAYFRARFFFARFTVS